MEKRVLIITGDGGESYETWYAVHRFQEAGTKRASRRHRGSGCTS